jgi:PilZ domain
VKDFHGLPKCQTWTNRARRPISTDEETVAHSEWQAVEDEPGSENRRYPRLSCGGIADLRVIPDGVKETGCLINLSKRGCCFLADESLRGQAGSTIEVHLKVKGIDLRVAGVIRHVHKGGVRAGIEFVALSDRKCEQVDELIAELTEMDRQSAHLRKQTPKTGRKQFVSLAESVQQEQPIESPVYRNLLRFYRG